MAEETNRQRGEEPQVSGLQAETALQVDDNLQDSDSAYGVSEGSASCLSSLHSSILNYRYENGRRYHAFRAGAYLLPNDEEEQSRMDLVHHIYTLLLGGKLHLAPICEKPQRVLDLGTGTGIWAMDFADERPSAHVLGIDLSPIQPEWTPPNCIFEIDDFEQEWVYHSPFDFIHAREIEGCIANDDLLFQRAFQNLAPGGYLEMQAVSGQFLCDDGTIEKAPDAQLWMKALVEGSAKFGKPVDNAPGWKGKFEKIGFVDVHQEICKLPIGAWPKDPKLKEIGKYQSVQELQVIDSYTPQLFSHVLGWKQEEIQVFMAKVKKDLMDPSIHIYLPVYIVWGKKP